MPLALGGIQAVGASLVLYYEERPPLMSREQDVLVGIEGAPATAALRRAGLSVELREAPVARQVSQVAGIAEPACALGLYRTPERERLGKYSRRPIYVSPPQGVLTRADSPLLAGVNSFAGLMASPGFTLVLRNGYSYGAGMDRVLAGARSKIIRSPDSSASRARMVLRGLADGSLFTAEEAATLIEQLGAEGTALSLRIFPDTPPGEGRYFFCSRSVPDSTMEALDNALAGPREAPGPSTPSVPSTPRTPSSPSALRRIPPIVSDP